MTVSTENEHSAKERARSVWGASPAGSTHAPDQVPGTQSFFERVRERRATVELPFLHELVPFAEWRGKRVLELGCGAGFDAYEICAAGAEYTGIDLTPENPVRTRAHLGFYGYHPPVLVADAEQVPFDDGTFDVVFSNGVLHHTPDTAASFREAFRVLRRGGEFWVILYHRHSVFHWVNLWMVHHILLLGFLRMSFRERLARIEYTTSEARPLVNTFSRGEVKRILTRSEFVVKNVWVRRVTADDFPNLPIVRWVWRMIPQRLLDVTGHWFGWYVIAKSVKA